MKKHVNYFWRMKVLEVSLLCFALVSIVTIVFMAHKEQQSTTFSISGFMDSYPGILNAILGFMVVLFILTLFVFVGSIRQRGTDRKFHNLHVLYRIFHTRVEVLRKNRTIRSSGCRDSRFLEQHEVMKGVFVSFDSFNPDDFSRCLNGTGEMVMYCHRKSRRRAQMFADYVIWNYVVGKNQSAFRVVPVPDDNLEINFSVDPPLPDSGESEKSKVNKSGES